MSAPYAKTVMTRQRRQAAGWERARRGSGRPVTVLLASLGAACISASAVLVKLADTGAATTAFYRCLLAAAGAGRAGRDWSSAGSGRGRWRGPLGPVLAGAVPGRRLGAVEPRDRRRRGGHRHGARQPAGAVRRRRRLAALPGAPRPRVLPRAARGAWPASCWCPGWPAAPPAIHRSAGSGTASGRRSPTRASCSSCARPRPRTPHVAGPLAEATPGAAAGAAGARPGVRRLQLHIGWQSLGWLLLLAMTSQTAGWLLITSSLPRLPAAMSSLMLLLQPAAVDPAGRHRAGRAAHPAAARRRGAGLRRRARGLPGRAASGCPTCAGTGPGNPGRPRTRSPRSPRSRPPTGQASTSSLSPRRCGQARWPALPIVSPPRSPGQRQILGC